jgi:hypothetical protein
VAAAILYGELHWRSGTRELRDRLEATKVPIEPKIFGRLELAGAPAPVQRYFHAVLNNGQPMMAAVRVEHTGTFNIDAAANKWKPFTSTQRVVTRRPGFDWDARVAMLPGVPVLVHDAYVAREGTLHAAVLGLLSVATLHGTREVAQGELMRFFAEAAWYPTALLPSQNVRWDAVDAHSARATLKDGNLTLTLLFRFNEAGLIDTVFAESRGQLVFPECNERRPCAKRCDQTEACQAGARTAHEPVRPPLPSMPASGLTGARRSNETSRCGERHRRPRPTAPPMLHGTADDCVPWRASLAAPGDRGPTEVS